MRAASSLLALSFAVLVTACSGGGDGASDQTGGSSSTETTGQGGQPTGGGGQGGETSTGTDGGGGAGGSQGGSGQGGTGAGASGGGGAAGGDPGDAWGPEQCKEPPAGVEIGVEIGQQLPNFVVKSCDGEDFSLEELCGAKAVFLFAAFGWCPLCKNVSANAEALHDSFAGQGLASAIVVVETAAVEPPTADYCKIWRDQFGLQDVLTLYDPTGSFLDIWPGGSSSLSVFLNQDRIVVDKLVHDGNIDTIKADIQSALDQ